MSRFPRLVLLATAVLPFACGGFSSGLPSNTKASDLSSAQAQQYCDRLADYYDRELGDRWAEFSCQLSGVIAGQMTEAFNPGTGRQACEDAAQSCREDGGGGTGSLREECSFGGCTATVGELERCHAAQLVKLREVLEKNTASCDPATWDESSGSELDYDTPEECEALGEACGG